MQLVYLVQHLYASTVLPSIMPPLAAHHIKALTKLSPHLPITSSLAHHFTDWTGKYPSRSYEAIKTSTDQWHGTCILRPANVEQVSSILKYATTNKIPVVTQGGNTGLVGGGVPIQEDEVVLLTSAMNKIIEFDKDTGIILAEAGCILETLQDHVRPHGYEMPIDLGAKGSCQIGGNVATNAGGIKYIRHGSLHANVLGLEVVTPDGKVLDLSRSLKKDNTGYSLKDLFIGSEGTLGVITKVAIESKPISKETFLMLVGFQTFPEVVAFFRQAKRYFGMLNAFEFWDQVAHEQVVHHLKLQSPLPTCPFQVLFETEKDPLDFLEESGAEQCVLADSVSQQLNLWSLREGIPEALSKCGKVWKWDVSVPIDRMMSVVENLEGDIVSGYGHLGDGNLHLNIVKSSMSKEMERSIYAKVASMGGSISAEHGIGQAKSEYLPLSKDANSLEVMRNIKAVLDPAGIMNPGKIFPSASKEC